MKRRTFLLGTAGALTLAGGAAGFALTRTPLRALEPWWSAGLNAADIRRFVLEYAILAPNPHNRQPWIVELLQNGDMMLFCDLDRRLPETDPFDRQIVIGLGAFVELAAIAASRLGYELNVTPFPEGEPQPRLDTRPIARLRLIKGNTSPDPLFAHVLKRRSTKQPYDIAHAMPDDAVTALQALSASQLPLSVIRDPAKVALVRDLTWKSWIIEATTERTHLETVRLMRIGRREIEANPDGVSLGGPFLEALSLAGVLTREEMALPKSSARAQGEARYKTMLAATNAYVTIVSPQNSRAGELAAGRTYLRANLTATGLGLCMQPVSQALQEFPEMVATRKALETELGIMAPARLHMLARIGYGPEMPPTPRWPAISRVRKSQV
jgi:hypothetical protein